MGLYVMALYGGQLGAVPAGFISDSMGWPWVLWWCAILNAIGFIVCFFLMEETMYHREVIPLSNTPSSEAVQEKVGEDSKITGTSVPEESNGLGTSYPVKTYWQKLAFFVPLNRRRNTFFEKVYRPLQMLRFPGVIFGGFIYGCFLNWFALVNATVSIFLTSPPYEWKASVRSFFSPRG